MKTLEERIEQLEERLTALEGSVQAQLTAEQIGQEIANKISEAIKTI